MNDLVSIIVPVYRVEPYLNRCIESIVQQTYEQLEIILVDDGSPDNCPAMCDAWAEKDSRIKVIHKSNGGLSDARNAGLKIAAGDYIAFVDSDDWIHEQYIIQLYRAAKKHHVEIAACDIRVVYGQEQQPILANPVVQVYETEKALETLIHGDVFRAVVWNKLYHRTLLHGEQFETGRYHEDEFFTYRIMGKVQKMAFVHVPLYYYFQRAGSIMDSLSWKHLDALDAYLGRICYFEHHFPRLYSMDKKNFCISCVYLYQRSLELEDQQQKQCAAKIKACRAKVKFLPAEWKEYSFKERVYLAGSRICIDLLSHLLLLRKKMNK